MYQSELGFVTTKAHSLLYSYSGMDPESVNTTETMEIDISKEAGGLPNILDTSTLCHLHRLLFFVVEKGLSTEILKCIHFLFIAQPVPRIPP